MDKWNRRTNCEYKLRGYESIKEDIAQKPDSEYKNELLSIFELYDELNDFLPNENFRKNELSPYIPVEPEAKPVTVEPKIGRNEPCPCGSGKKYKKCCLNK